jgi:protein-S-isoprenylcysteine O-methyltransferase Ste14
MARRQEQPTTATASEPSVPPSGDTMLPPRKRRRPAETVFMRVVATAGVVAIGVAIAAILGSSDVEAWIIGLVVSLVSVVLAAVLWSSRQL